ncbi:MAG: hypothetical protein Q8M39_04000 [Sulfuricurvum sp.]|nr:hypothetical protein [Sulfuricurvum sp.]
MIYNWERFWIKKGGEYHPDRYGFLYDPNELHSPNYECKTFADLQENSLLFLLGEPGIGKSKTIEQIYTTLKNNQQNVHLINLRLVNDAITLQEKVFNDPIVQDWQSTDTDLELFLDSYDEGLLGFENITAHIIDNFRKISQEKLKTLKLRIICRTAELPQMLENELKELFRQSEDKKNKEISHELLILRYKDIEDVLRIEQIVADDFIRHIEQNDLSVFVSIPVTLIMLINLFKQNNFLPHGKWEIFSKGLLHLAKEQSEQRKTIGKIGVLSPDDRLALASRTAFYFLFANKHTFILEDDLLLLESHDDLKSNEVASKEYIKELINTSLFAARENGRFGFIHRTFIDFLATKYILDNDISIDVIIPMLIDMKSSYKRVYPQLMEVASWLATQRIEYFDVLKNYNPDVIVQGDLSKLSNQQKDELIDQCLKAIENEIINQVHYDTLKYFPKLLTKETTNLLKQYFFSSPRNIFSRRVAIDIAKICEIKEVEKYIFQILHNSIEYLPLRISAMEYIAKLNSGTYTEELKYYAIGIEEDKDDELKGFALKALFPNHINIDELLLLLTSQKQKNLYGKYQKFLQHEFCSILTEAQISVIIQWLIHNHDNGLYRELIHPVIVKAWEYIDHNIIILRLLTDLIEFNYQKYHRFPESYSKPMFKELWERDTQKRHKIIQEIVSRQSRISAQFSSIVYKNEVHLEEDLLWNIEQLKNSSNENEQKIYAQMLRQKYGWVNNAENVKRLLELAESFQTVKEVFSDYLEPVELDSNKASEDKQLYNELLIDHSSYETQKFETNIVEIQLLLINEGDLEIINKLIYKLTYLDEYESYKNNTGKIFLESLTSDEQTKIINLLKYFIESMSFPSQGFENLDNDEYSRNLCRAYMLLYRYKSDELESITPKILSEHIYVLMYFSFRYGKYVGQEEFAYLAQKVYYADQQKFNNSLLEIIRHFDNDKTIIDFFQYIYPINNIQMSTLDDLMDLVVGKKVSADFEKVILNFLLEKKYEKALAYLKEIITVPSVIGTFLPFANTKNLSDEYIQNALWLLTVKDKEFDRVIKYLYSNLTKAEEYILGAFGEGQEQEISKNLTEMELAEFYILIYMLFPPISDLKTPLGTSYLQTPIMSVSSLRNHILQKIVSFGTYGSLDALRLIHKKIPNHKFLFYYINQAIETTNRMQVKFYSIDQLKKLEDKDILCLK